MSAYAISVKRSAAKALARVPKRWRERIVTAVHTLKEEPRPDGCKKLKGSPVLYRIRVGDYRVVYEIKDEVLRVLIIRIAHRSKAYR